MASGGGSVRSEPLAELRSAVTQAAGRVGSNGAAPSSVRVERPKREGQGDYSTNLAMLLAPALRQAPRDIAEQVGSALHGLLASDLERFEIAGRDAALRKFLAVLRDTRGARERLLQARKLQGAQLVDTGPLDRFGPVERRSAQYLLRHFFLPAGLIYGGPPSAAIRSATPRRPPSTYRFFWLRGLWQAHGA